MLLGRRYYHPALGRWLTQDPEGFDNGPNLYAYVANCPLTRIDLFGLREFYPHYFEGDALDFPEFSYSKLRRMGHVTPEFYGFENAFTNKSRLFDLKNHGRPDLPNGKRISFINGINNTFDDATQSTLYLSDLTGGYNINAVYNATHGLGVDVAECIMGLLQGVATTPVSMLHQDWNNHFAHSDEIYLQFCHSQGAILTKMALESYPEDLRQRIDVVGIAPAAYIPKELCHSVVHYEAAWYRDFIPRISISDRWQCCDTAQVVPSHPNAPPFDHRFSSPTFKKYIADQLNLYLGK